MKGLRRFALGCVLSLVLSGCALGNALQRGHDHVSQRHYRAALASYQAAQQIDPDSEEARRLTAQLTPYAVGEATMEARGEMARGRYEQAHVLARYVAALNRQTAASIDHDNAASMHAAGEKLLKKADHLAAYGISARLRDLYPQHAAVPSLLKRCRLHFFTLAEQHASLGEFKAALRATATVARFEPALRREVQQRRSTLKGRWAKQIALRGAAHEQAQRHGAAAALFARAYEIAGKGAHLAALRRNTAPLRADGRFVLAVHTREGGHADVLVDDIRQLAREVEGLSLPTASDDGASLIATVSAASARCREDTELEQGEQPYVSGYRREANPEYQRLSNDVVQLERKLDKQQHALSAAHQQAHRLRDQAEHCENQLTSAKQQLNEAKSTLAAARAKVQRLQRKADRLQAKLDALAPRAPKRQRLKRRLEEMRGRLAAAKQEARSAKRQTKQHHHEHHQAAARCAAKRKRLHQQRSKSAHLADDHAQSSDRLAQVQAQRLTTPAQLDVEVIDIFRFPIRHVTRSCVVSAKLALTPAWTSARQSQLRASDETRDRSHQGYPRFGVAADLLHFASDDAELIAGADRQAAALAVAAIARRTTEYYAHMTQNAFDTAADDPHGATELMLAMLLAAPGQLSDKHKRTLSQHLAKNYDLQHWQTLTK